MREVVDAEQPNLDPAEIEDVILGCGHPEGCMGMNMARIAAMAAGIPKEVAGDHGQPLLLVGLAGHHDGREPDRAGGRGRRDRRRGRDDHDDAGRHPEHEPTWSTRRPRERFPGLYFPMGITAEVVADRYGVSREDQDAYAPAEPAALRRRGREGLDRRRDRADEGDPQGHQEGRRALRRGRSRSTRTSATARRRRSRARQAEARCSRRKAARSPPATPRSSPTAPRPRCMMSDERAKQL